MKRLIFTLISVLFALILPMVSSCGNDKDSSLTNFISDSSEQIRTYEYSVEFFDENTYMSSFATGTLEVTQTPYYSFITDKVTELSGLPVTINSINEKNGDIYIDFDGDFFFGESNSEKNEKSILKSMNSAIVTNFDNINNVHFGIDGKDFNTSFHSFSRSAPFSEELLNTKKEPVTVEYTIDYYDVIEDKTKSVSETKVFYGTPAPEYFIEMLSELSQIHIAFNSVSSMEDTITIDFKKSGSPVSGTGAYEESRILDSIANVMFDVYPEVKYIYITADSGRYESGHISVEKDIPYAERKDF